MGRGELDIVPYSTILKSIHHTGHMPQATYVGTLAIRVNMEYVVGCFCLGRFSGGAFGYQERCRTKVDFFPGKSWVLTYQAYICHNKQLI